MTGDSAILQRAIYWISCALHNSKGITKDTIGKLRKFPIRIYKFLFCKCSILGCIVKDINYFLQKISNLYISLIIWIFQNLANIKTWYCLNSPWSLLFNGKIGYEIFPLVPKIFVKNQAENFSQKYALYVAFSQITFFPQIKINDRLYHRKAEKISYPMI